MAVVILMVTGLLVYQSGKSSREAEDKADQLVAQLAEFGLRTPTKDQIVRVLGDDGGAVCANPGSPLTRAALAAQLSNGAGGPGMRPVIADTRFLQGELAILSVYCPDQLGKVKEYVDSLRTGEVAG
ncbi:MAG: hypothetical protein ACJ73E_05265 [Mycobacteriales bacterium]